MNDPIQMNTLIYNELKHIAARFLNQGLTLEPTALVHEAYLRLNDRHFESETHFRAVAAVAMRQVIIDRARRRQAAKRGGPVQERITLSGLGVMDQGELLLDLNQALSRLEDLDPRKGRVAELRLFAGMKLEEIAISLHVSKKTIQRDWVTARAWLRSALA